MNIRPGQLYVSEYGTRYQVLAVWDRWAWTLVIFPRVSAKGQPQEPRTYPHTFFARPPMRRIRDEAVAA